MYAAFNLRFDLWDRKNLKRIRSPSSHISRLHIIGRQMVLNRNKGIMRSSFCGQRFYVFLLLEDSHKFFILILSVRTIGKGPKTGLFNDSSAAAVPKFYDLLISEIKSSL